MAPVCSGGWTWGNRFKWPTSRPSFLSVRLGPPAGREKRGVSRSPESRAELTWNPPSKVCVESLSYEQRAFPISGSSPAAFRPQSTTGIFLIQTRDTPCSGRCFVNVGAFAYRGQAPPGTPSGAFSCLGLVTTFGVGKPVG